MLNKKYTTPISQFLPFEEKKTFPTSNWTKSQVFPGFTLVELIVVVTILAILATIGFVSYSSYLTGVRDTNRLAQLVSIHDGLTLYSTRNNLPLPDDNVEVKVNTTLIAYQGYAGSNTLETIDFTKGGKDPRDDQYFTYYLTKDRKYFQLMGFLEESVDISTRNSLSSPLAVNLMEKSFAVDYTDRIPSVYGKKLGILTDTDNTPIQEISSISSVGELDIDSSINGYTAHLSDDLRFDDSKILSINPDSSCRKIKLLSATAKSGIYKIDPTGTGSISVYCEMSSEYYGYAKYFQNESEILGLYNFEKDGDDGSGNKNHGTVASSGINFDDGIIGEAAIFDNTTGGIDITENNFNNLGIFSISYWVRPDGGHKNYNGTIMSSGNRNGNHWSIGLTQTNSQFRDRGAPGGTQNYTFQIGEWHHVVMTRENNGIISTYVNGELIGSRTNTYVVFSTDAVNTQIGRETYAGGYFAFNGGIDNLRLYNRVLDPAEITTLYFEGL